MKWWVFLMAMMAGICLGGAVGAMASAGIIPIYFPCVAYTGSNVTMTVGKTKLRNTTKQDITGQLTASLRCQTGYLMNNSCSFGWSLSLYQITSVVNAPFVLVGSTTSDIPTLGCGGSQNFDSGVFDFGMLPTGGYMMDANIFGSQPAGPPSPVEYEFATYRYDFWGNRL